MSPSQSAAATRYSSERLISAISSWNHASVGNATTSEHLQDREDGDEVERGVRADVRAQGPAPLVDQRQPHPEQADRQLQHQLLREVALPRVRDREQHPRGDRADPQTVAIAQRAEEQAP